MNTRAAALPLLLAVPALAAPCTHDAFRKSLGDHCLQLSDEGQRAFRQGETAEKAQDPKAARKAFATAFGLLRQAGRLSARPEATTFPPPVVRLLLARSAEASRRFSAACRSLGEAEEIIAQELEALKQQADIELQQRLDCIAAFKEQ